MAAKHRRNGRRFSGGRARAADEDNIPPRNGRRPAHAQRGTDNTPGAVALDRPADLLGGNESDPCLPGTVF